MSVTERGALLALLRGSGQGWGAIADEVESAGSALAVLREGLPGLGRAPEQLSLLPGGADSDDAVLGDADPDELAEKAELEIQAWEREGLRFVTLLDPGYPAQLLTVHQRPAFVMMKGQPDAADARAIAIVGTRAASPEGVQRARHLAASLARAGVPVVSGLAAGIDTGALEGALEAGGRAVAVIGTGLHHSYPKSNAPLQERIAREGLVISQFLPDAPPTKASFPMRNAVMSGYAAATVVVEAPFNSGARMQARLALEHGRRVFLLESLMANEWARGYAQRPNTVVVRTADDVLGNVEPVLGVSGDLIWS